MQSSNIKNNFFGRQQHLEILERRINDIKYGYRQNIAILGDELVGKTSAIFNFLGKLYDNYIVVLYLEARPETLNSFCRRFIAVLLYNFLINSALPLKDDLDFLIAKSKKFLPQTTEKIGHILALLTKRKKDTIFTDLLSLCELVYQESGKHCVVIIDEFHNLESTGIPNLYPSWSKSLIQQKHTLFIITSSMKYRAKNILAKNLSLLFGNFQIINMEPFDTQTSIAYIDYKLSHLTLEMPIKKFLINFTAGHPFYLTIILRAIAKEPSADIVDNLEELLFSASGVLNQKFSDYLKRLADSQFAQDYISILYLIASGHNKLKDIASYMHKPKKQLLQKITHLLDLGFINRSADFLKINDRVFGFWIKFVYQEKMNSLTFDARDKKVIFRDKIKELMQEFFLSAQKTILQRINELVHLFEDDLIQLNNKKLRLNLFREIKPVEFGAKDLKEGLVCRSKDSLWVIAFKNDLLTEKDIAEFSNECKRYRHKAQRKIIISCEGLDANTRLKAMDEKIITWDLNNVNQILDLFYKPRLITSKTP